MNRMGFFVNGDMTDAMKSSPRNKKTKKKRDEATEKSCDSDTLTSYEEWRDEVEQLKQRCQELEERCKALEQYVDYKSNCQNCRAHMERLLGSGTLDTVCRTCTCFPFL